MTANAACLIGWVLVLALALVILAPSVAFADRVTPEKEEAEPAPSDGESTRKP